MRSKRSRRPDDFAKPIVALTLLLAFAFGAKGGLPGIMSATVIALFVLAVAGVGWLFIKKQLPAAPDSPSKQVSTRTPDPSTPWSEARIIERLHAIDWFHFEKLNAAILEQEGWTVERKGGATPDGGVDLIATKGDVVMLVQCKHWKTWIVQEKVIRELLGSMTHYRVNRGALHTLKGWTKPAGRFAADTISGCQMKPTWRAGHAPH